MHFEPLAVQELVRFNPNPHRHQNDGRGYHGGKPSRLRSSSAPSNDVLEYAAIERIRWWVPRMDVLEGCARRRGIQLK
jgi:hypothetical protein